jgi:hypothetical protein
MTDLTRFTYLINQCLKFLWTREQQEEIQRLANEAVKEIKELRMELKGADNFNDYLNKQNIDIAKEIGELRAENERMQAWKESAINAYPELAGMKEGTQ